MNKTPIIFLLSIALIVQGMSVLIFDPRNNDYNKGFQDASKNQIEFIMKTARNCQGAGFVFRNNDVETLNFTCEQMKAAYSTSTNSAIVKFN